MSYFVLDGNSTLCNVIFILIIVTQTIDYKFKLVITAIVDS